MGQVVAVRPGDRVPVDGAVVAGASLVDQANLTGESRPVSKSALAQDEVFAGTVNCGGGYLEVECTKVSSDSTVAKMVALVEQAHMQSSPTEQRVKKVARWQQFGAANELVKRAIEKPREGWEVLTSR